MRVCAVAIGSLLLLLGTVPAARADLVADCRKASELFKEDSDAFDKMPNDNETDFVKLCQLGRSTYIPILQARIAAWEANISNTCTPGPKEAMPGLREYLGLITKRVNEACVKAGIK
jgi:hypothetical protein